MGNFLHSEELNITIQFGREGNGNKCNYIETTKYSLLTFLPKSLLLQFIRPANYVYLIAAIAQSIPAISSLSPITAIAPLIFVLAVALIKEAIEDFVLFLLFRNDIEKIDRQTVKQHKYYQMHNLFHVDGMKSM